MTFCEENSLLRTNFAHPKIIQLYNKLIILIGKKWQLKHQILQTWSLYFSSFWQMLANEIILWSINKLKAIRIPDKFIDQPFSPVKSHLLFPDKIIRNMHVWLKAIIQNYLQIVNINFWVGVTCWMIASQMRILLIIGAAFSCSIMLLFHSVM